MAKERPLYEDRISIDPEIMAGKPVVKGTRIPVALVLGHLAGNPDLDELFAAYPELTVEDVKACLAYAHRLVEGRKAAPKAKLAPVEDADSQRAEALRVWAEMDELAQEIGAHWPKGVSAVEAVEEQRREL